VARPKSSSAETVASLKMLATGANAAPTRSPPPRLAQARIGTSAPERAARQQDHSASALGEALSAP
jgi:hypothetical protein